VGAGSASAGLEAAGCSATVHGIYDRFDGPKPGVAPLLPGDPAPRGDPMPTALTEDEQRQRLADVPGWTIDGDALTRTFTFPSFVVAFGFMASAAIIAEKLHHHPEWSNVYNRVTVRLTTHDVGGISELDFELAATMTDLAGTAS
jgi:4a-hydroxytetrahydrobiopterin dehydratase